jgi:hypothetical protein
VAALASCAAFLALPFVAPTAGATVFLVLTAFWSATSSALRAPPMALVSRHVPESKQPWIAGMYLLGIGVASGLAPFAALVLKGVDPRVPFAMASIALGAFALLLAQAERGYEAKKPAPADPGKAPARMRVFALASAVVLLAFGFQVHFSINTAPAWLRVASADSLPWLMPIFWLGFNLAIIPATFLPRRHGAMNVMCLGAIVGAIALAVVPVAPNLKVVTVCQLFAGAAWAVALNSAFTVALESGRIGKEGMVTGVLFSILAVAALARVGATVAGWQHGLTFAPGLAWMAAATIVIALVKRSPAPPRASGPA